MDRRTERQRDRKTERPEGENKKSRKAEMLKRGETEE